MALGSLWIYYSDKISDVDHNAPYGEDLTFKYRTKIIGKHQKDIMTGKFRRCRPTSKTRAFL